MTSRAFSSLLVMIATSESPSIIKDVSTSCPSTSPAIAAFASPEPIDEATSATVRDCSYDLTVPSGSVTLGISHEKNKKSNFTLIDSIPLQKIRL